MARFCRNCGTALPDGAAFCPECGEKTPMPAPQKPKDPFCRNCGQRLPEGATFCPECGEAVLNAADAPKKVPAVPSKTEAKPKSAPSKADPMEQPDKTARSDVGRGKSAPKSARTKAAPAGTTAVKAAQAKSASAKTSSSQTPPKKRGLSFFLVLVMLFELGIAAFKYPGFLVPETNDPTNLWGQTGNTGSGTGNNASGGSTSSTSSDGSSEPFVSEDLYQLGTPGVDFAVGAGPESVDYQQMDGYGVETLISYSQSELDAAPARTISVSAESGIAAVDGVTVDFGEGCLEHETETLVLRTLPTKTDTANGYWAAAWDLTLSGEKKIPVMAELTVPCDSGRLMDVIAQQYDETLGRWVYIAYSVDTQASTVTMYLDHLAPVALFTLMQSDSTRAAAPTPRKNAGASLSDLFGGSDVQQLRSRESQIVKFGLMPQELEEAVKNCPDIETAIINDSEEIRKMAEAGEFAALYEPNAILGFVSDNLTNVIDGASLACSFAEFAKDLPPALSGPLTAVSLAITVCQTGWDAMVTYFEKGLLSAAVEVDKHMDDIVVGAAALYAVGEYFGMVPPAWWAEPKLLLAVGAFLLVKNVMIKVFKEPSKIVKKEPTLEELYRVAPYNNVYWDKTKEKLTWFPSEGLLRKITEKVDDATCGRGQAYVKEHPDEVICIKFEEIEELSLLFGLDKIEFKNYRYVELNDDFFKTYNRLMAQQKILQSDPGTDFFDKNYQYMGALSANRNDWYNQGWRSLLHHIKETNPNDPDQWFPVLMKYMDRIEQLSYNYAYDMATLLGMPMGALDYTKENLYNDIFYRLQRREIYQKFVKECIAQGKTKSIESLASFKKHVNRKIKFKLVNQNGKPITFDETQYAGKYIVINTNPELYELRDPWVAKMDESEFCNCTYVGYCLAGKPTALLVYDSKADYEKDKDPIQTITMNPVGENDKSVTVRLKVEKKEEPKEPEQTTQGVYQLRIKQDDSLNTSYVEKRDFPMDITVTIKGDTFTVVIPAVDLTMPTREEWAEKEDGAPLKDRTEYTLGGGKSIPVSSDSFTFHRPGMTLTGTVTDRKEYAVGGFELRGTLNDTSAFTATSKRSIMRYEYGERSEVETTAVGDSTEGRFWFYQYSDGNVSVTVRFTADSTWTYEISGLLEYERWTYDFKTGESTGTIVPANPPSTKETRERKSQDWDINMVNYNDE